MLSLGPRTASAVETKDSTVWKKVGSLSNRLMKSFWTVQLLPCSIIDCISMIICSPRLPNSGWVIANVGRDGGNSGPSLRNEGPTPAAGVDAIAKEKGLRF